MQWTKDEFILTDELKRLDVDRVCDMLSKTYWADKTPREKIIKSLQKSLCFSVFHDKTQVAFARVVTDEALFSWIADVIVDDQYRGRGIGKWMMETITNHEKVKDTKQVLATRNAHGLYEQYGFKKSELMRKTPDCFK